MNEVAGEVCFSCESDVPERARFCPACGVSIQGATVMLDPLGALETESGEVQGRARRVGPGNRRLGAVAAVVVGVVIAAVAMNGPGDAGVPDEASGQRAEAAPEDAQDGSEGANSADASTDDATTAGEAGESDTSGNVGADWPPRTVAAFEGDGQPPLGESVGRYMFVTRSADVVRLDLDTGASEVYQTLAQPVVALGDEVLMWSRRGLIAVDGGDSSSEPRVVYNRPVDGTLRSFLEAVIVMDGDRLVFEFALFSSGDAGSAKVLVDLSSGVSTNVVLPPGSESVGGLVSVPGGGTFDFVEGDFRPVFEGEVVSAGRRSLVGYRCLDPTDCGSVLVDRVSGRVLDTALPDVGTETRMFFVGPEDRFLMVMTDRTRLWDLDQGRFVADDFLDAMAADGPPRETPVQVAVSSDGRWVGSGKFNTVRVLDLDGEVEHAIELPPSTVRLENISQVIFVDKADPADSETTGDG